MSSSRLALLYSRDQIKCRVAELAKRINSDYAGRDLVVIGVLKGAFVFLADLVREIELDVRVGFVSVSSYGSETESSGTPAVRVPTDLRIAGQDVLVVEDLLDTGRSITALIDDLRGCAPCSIRLCVLIDKCERRATPLEADYVGFQLAEGFVVGYGLDYADRYRALPEIFMLDLSTTCSQPTGVSLSGRVERP
jgi:hypoxanthine phosphoribosyltransferase